MGHWREIQQISIRGPLRLDIHTPPRLTSFCNHPVSSIIILLGCTVAAAAVRASELKSSRDWLRQNYMDDFSAYYIWVVNHDNRRWSYFSNNNMVKEIEKVRNKLTMSNFMQLCTRSNINMASFQKNNNNNMVIYRGRF